jgi:hypothetical protein
MDERARRCSSLALLKVVLNELFTFVVLRFRSDWTLDAANAARRMHDMRAVVAALVALVLGTPAIQGTVPAPSTHTNADIAGAWILNRDLTTVPQSDDADRGSGEHRRGGYGGSGGGPGGFGGGFGRPGGIGGGVERPSDEQLRKMAVLRRRLTEVPDRLVVVRDVKSVSITDGNGRRMNYKIDGKKQDQFTGDGEFTTKTRFDGNRLIVEEDFGGRRITTTYSPVLDGDTPRLEVTVKPEDGRVFEGGRGGPGHSSNNLPAAPRREFKRVYDLEARGQPGYFF